MVTNKANLNSVCGSCIEGSVFSARPFILMLMMLTLLLPLIAQADGLFDFQMKLAKKGNAEAQYKVGEMYETGFGVKQDLKEATSWIKKSANQGHETAGFKLLYWDVEKNGVKGKNKAKVSDLKTKAAKGNAQAQYYIGKMYAHGVGLKKDPDIAIGWLNKAALVGVLEAERELTSVREDKQRQTNALAKYRREKKQAELKVKQQHEKQLKLEQQRKLQAQKKAESKQRADTIARQQKAADKKASLLAQKTAEKKQREAEKKALLKKREVKKERAKEQQVESDLCSGKSARFISTCR